MEALGSSSHWACSCQNVAAHCCVILSIRAHFLHTGDCAALLTLAQVCCASHILLHLHFNQCKIKPYKFQGICQIFCFGMMFFESWFYIWIRVFYLYVQTEPSQTISWSNGVSHPPHASQVSPNTILQGHQSCKRHANKPEWLFPLYQNWNWCSHTFFQGWHITVERSGSARLTKSWNHIAESCRNPVLEEYQHPATAACVSVWSISIKSWFSWSSSHWPG